MLYVTMIAAEYSLYLFHGEEPRLEDQSNGFFYASCHIKSGLQVPQFMFNLTRFQISWDAIFSTSKTCDLFQDYIPIKRFSHAH